MLAAMLVLSSCFFPEKFTAEIEIFKNGTYRFTYDGILTFVPGKAEETQSGSLSAQVEGELKGLEKKLKKEDSGFKKVEYLGHAQYKVLYERSAPLTAPFYFLSHELKIISIIPRNNNTVEVEGMELDQNDLVQMQQLGMKIDGTVKVSTDGLVRAHNAKSTPSFFGLVGSYTWSISSIKDPAPYMLIDLKPQAPAVPEPTAEPTTPKTTEPLAKQPVVSPAAGDSAEKSVQQIKALVDDGKYEEADRKLNELRRQFPNLCSSDVPIQTRIDAGIHQVKVDVELGRVKEKVLKDTSIISGKVEEKRGAGGDIAFDVVFDAGPRVSFHCDGGCDGTTVYWLIDDRPVEFGEGFENLKDRFEEVKLYVSSVERGCIETLMANGYCEEELCPVAVAMYSAQKTAEPEAMRTVAFEKPIATADIRAKSILFEDPSLRKKSGELEASDSVGITGFVRDNTRRITAVQILHPDQRKPFYLKKEDMGEIRQLDENGGYFKSLTGSLVFNPGGKTSAKETMKSIDAYLTAQPQGQQGADAILDYLLCLDWLLRNDPSTNKDALVRLADIYLAKAKERFPDRPETHQAEAVVQKLKGSAKQ